MCDVTARYFALELKNGDIDLEYLTALQREAEKGTLQRCMFSYIQWLKELFLVSVDTQKEFVSLLKEMFETRRNDFRESGIQCHGRVPEAVAHLRIGMDMFLFFLKDNGNIPEDYMKYMAKRFKDILYDLAQKQADNIVQDKPTHKFIRKLYALIESNQCCLLPRNRINDFTPGTCIGYEDDTFLYLNCDLAHRAVKKLCEDQGEAFTISCKALLKQLAEEDLIFTSAGQNTRSVRINGKSKRLLCLYREKHSSLQTEYCDFYVWQALRNSKNGCGAKRILQRRIRHRSAAQVLHDTEKMFSISAVTLQKSLEANLKKHCSSSGNGLCSWKHT